MVECFLNAKKEIYLFIDLIQFKDTLTISKFIAISSGFSIAKCNPLFPPHFRYLCSEIYSHVSMNYLQKMMKGYTDKEVNTVIQHLNKASINVDGVKQLAGTNLYLLSFLKCTTDLNSFLIEVEHHIIHFLQHNMSFANNPQSFTEVLALYKWEMGRKYIRLALQGKNFLLKKAKHTNTHGCVRIIC